jgi:hypothetical protein
MFERLVHADWSTHANKRWMAAAIRNGSGWNVDAAQRVPALDEFLDQWLFAGPSVLAGFDFPIGLPQEFGRKTGFMDFRDALSSFGEGIWSKFFIPAERVEEIAIERPFYPANSCGKPRHSELVSALGVQNIDQLRRRCEQKPPAEALPVPYFGLSVLIRWGKPL